ncbi:hypothetical protein BGX38DRAFT_1275486 [Terfezia claveryi]|nr:hypothetical protein BGX38DRAFT_1275486 [Terfezia claveryi]
MSPASSIGRSAYQTHRRNISVPIMSSSMIMTPPVSPPLSQAPGNPASTITNMSALRRPLPAHLNLSTMSSPTCQPVVTHNRHSQPPRPCNPYEIPQDDSQRSYSAGEPPHDYVYNGNSFDLHSGPASPVSPVLHSAFPLAAAGDESLIDRWLRHEAMGRPIFPGSRTGSSVATSDISSLRGGMFGSLPGGRATRPPSRYGPGSVTSAATRDRDNFTSSAPSYPSSRAGASRPASRDGNSVNGESYPPSIVSSEVYPPSIDTRLHYTHPAPPAAPTPPRSFVAPCSLMSASNASVVYNDETAMGSTVTLPEPAATRPPRYSDSLAAPPYQLPLAELINNGTVGYQAVPILTYGTATAATEKSLLGEMLNNPVGNSQSEGVVVMVRQEVWEELRRRAGLDAGMPDGSGHAVLPGGSSSGGVRPPNKRRILNSGRIKEKSGILNNDARCCGACIIC